MRRPHSPRGIDLAIVLAFPGLSASHASTPRGGPREHRRALADDACDACSPTAKTQRCPRSRAAPPTLRDSRRVPEDVSRAEKVPHTDGRATRMIASKKVIGLNRRNPQRAGSGGPGAASTALRSGCREILPSTDEAPTPTIVAPPAHRPGTALPRYHGARAQGCSFSRPQSEHLPLASASEAQSNRQRRHPGSQGSRVPKRVGRFVEQQREWCSPGVDHQDPTPSRAKALVAR